MRANLLSQHAFIYCSVMTDTLILTEKLYTQPKLNSAYMEPSDDLKGWQSEANIW